MLIGLGFYWQLRQTGPIAINTKLEWVLSGPVTDDEADDTTTTVTTACTPSRLDHLITN